MMVSYVLADVRRNLRRTLTTVVGVSLGVGLFCGVLFFIDGLTASMTQRSVAALAIDMQRVVPDTGSGVRLRQEVRPTDDPRVSKVALTVTNGGRYRARQVTIRSAPRDAGTVRPGSAYLDGRRIPSPAGTNPLASGATGAGRNIGTLAPGGRRRIVYRVATPPGRDPSIRSTVSTSESVSPVPANRPQQVGLGALAEKIAAIDGVRAAEPLSIAVLPDSAIHAAGRRAAGPGRIFGFDREYAAGRSDIRLLRGTWSADRAVISAEAASALGVSVGDPVTVALPDGSDVRLPVSGTADFSRAQSLFSSRRGGDLETFQYTRFSVAVGSKLFAERIQPAYQRALRTESDFKTPPTREVDIGLDRKALNADPTTALDQTQAIATTVMRQARYQDDYLLDNISNTLSVAVDDAATAKQLFVFLGVPGALLAAMLAAYAGNVLAETQRREHAILRIRGASRRRLLGMLALHTALVSAIGSLAGLAVGFGATRQLLGAESLGRARTGDLLTSAALGTTAGFVATGLALYLTARRSLDREINEDRAGFSRRVPLWRRLHLDLLLAGIVLVGTGVAWLMGAFAGEPGSVYFGRAVDLNVRLLILPLTAWVSGSLLAARFLSARLRRLDPGSRPDLRPLVRRLARLNVGRRVWPIANAGALVALITSLIATLAMFTASYEEAKQDDARFATGADLRLTQSPAADTPLAATDAHRLTGAAVPEATPVIFSTSNVILASARTSDPANLAAVDPVEYRKMAPLHDEHFLGSSSSRALEQLESDPRALLLSRDMAAFLKTKPGDQLDVLLVRATPKQHMVHLRVVGLFTRLAGFPEGADALINISRHSAAVPSKNPDFFLANADGPSDRALDAAVQALESPPGSDLGLRVATRREMLSGDQSSLAALNVRGLVSLDSGFALAMASVACGIFVLGLLLHRRREYVVLRAQGADARTIRLLILTEAGAVSVGGALAGVPVGLLMGFYFVRVLEPLFVLSPPLVVPSTAVLIPTAVAVVAGGLSAGLGHWLVQRLDPAELLRDG